MSTQETEMVNGKSNSPSTSTIPSVDPKPQEANRYEKILGHVRDIVELELRWNAAIIALETETKNLDVKEVPSVLYAFLKRPVFGLARFTKPSLPVTSGSPPPIDSSTINVDDDEEDDNFLSGHRLRVMELMKDGRERKSGAIIKSLKGEKIKSSIYSALTELVNAGLLIRPAYGHYRKP